MKYKVEFDNFEVRTYEADDEEHLGQVIIDDLEEDLCEEGQEVETDGYDFWVVDENGDEVIDEDGKRICKSVTNIEEV